jgi:hypothetical protein
MGSILSGFYKSGKGNKVSIVFVYGFTEDEAGRIPLHPWQSLSIQEQATRIADLSGCLSEQIDANAALYEGRSQWTQSASS